MKRSVWLVVVMVALALPGSAQAAFPGTNGKIAFYSSADGDREIYTINPDGSGLLQLTHNTVRDEVPSWSPDGRQIVFMRAHDVSGPANDVWKMNADGAGQTLVDEYSGTTPSWSADSQQIAFTKDGYCDPPPYEDGGVWTMNADGTNAAFLTCQYGRGACCTSWSPDGTRIVWSEAPGPPPAIYRHTFGGETVRLTAFDDGYGRTYPDWSPSAHKIMFTVSDDLSAERLPIRLFTMNPDGSEQAPLREGYNAVWSPDGAKIAFSYDGPPAGIWTANADGSGATFLTSGSAASWQPIPVTAYPRPKGASPARFSLVPAYLPCSSPNRTHGLPHAQPSCSPPAFSSLHLTLPAPEVNGMPAASQGHMRIKTVTGNPTAPPDEADVAVAVSVTSVHCNGANPPSTCGAANQSSTASVPDYTGELDAVVFLRITDKGSIPNPGGSRAATVQDFDLHFTVPCVGTQSVSLGSNCSTATTVEALLPGAITEGRRSIWELDRVQVRDGGADGDADTSGNRVFLRAGVFVP